MPPKDASVEDSVLFFCLVKKNKKRKNNGLVSWSGKWSGLGG